MCTPVSFWWMYLGATSRNDLLRLRKVSMRLYDVRVSSTPIYHSAPFNLSWKVNTTNGANQHTAIVDFNGTNYVSNYSNALASIAFNAPDIFADFLVNAPDCAVALVVG